MKKITPIISFLISISMASCNSSSDSGTKNKELSMQEITQSFKQSLVKVFCYDISKTTILAQGTGFFIDNTGTFITNHHVIDNSYYVQIQTSAGSKKWVSTVNYYDEKNSDYAICKIDNFKSTSVTFSDKYSNGNTVFALGFPNDSNTIKTTEGKVINKEIETNKKIKYIENNAKIDHGSSGGILSDKYGNVIGITTCELDSSNYGAIPYSSFKDNLKTKSVNKEPIECFHKVKTVRISSSTVQTYFNYKCVISTDSGYLTSCYYYVQFKDSYLNKVKTSTAGLYISFSFSITYTYYNTNSPSKTYTKDVTTIDSIKIYNFNINEVAEGYAILNASFTGSVKVTGKTAITMKPSSASGTFDIVN